MWGKVGCFCVTAVCVCACRITPCTVSSLASSTLIRMTVRRAGGKSQERIVILLRATFGNKERAKFLHPPFTTALTLKTRRQFWWERTQTCHSDKLAGVKVSSTNTKTNKQAAETSICSAPHFTRLDVHHYRPTNLVNKMISTRAESLSMFIFQNISFMNIS